MAGSINRSSLPSTAHLDATAAAHQATPAPAQAAGTPAAPALTTGARGPEVKALQEKLIKAGIQVQGGADGVFGKGTASAVAQFQKSKGLPATGAADAATLASLDKAVGTKPPTQTGTTGGEEEGPDQPGVALHPNPYRRNVCIASMSTVSRRRGRATGSIPRCR